jgi:oligopeptide transport system ATP-binding protein
MNDRVLRVQDLSVHYNVREGGLVRPRLHLLKAVDGVSFDLAAGETLGIVGESGCGKSTLARALLALIKPSRGRVLWLGEDLNKLDEEDLRKRRQDLQIVFQDPLAALNPRMTVRSIIAEPLWTFFPRIARVQVDERVRGVMQMVGLLPSQVNRYPHEFSAGQCQRLGIARALVLNPKLIVCDEPVSALDVSIQAQIINLLKDLQKKLNLSLVFIAHDLSVVKHISDRVMVMYLGRAMELSCRDHLYKRPLHPYTSALIKAVPVPDPKLARMASDTGLTGDMPSPLDPPSGCVFNSRCPFSVKRCQIEVPALRRMENGDWAACHRAEELDLSIGASDATTS